MDSKHIILTTDFSPQAQRCFAPVSRIAGRLGAKITLLHSVQVLVKPQQKGHLETPVIPFDLEGEKKLAEQALREQAQALDGNLDLELQLVSGTDVATTITDFAQEQGADVIALATHGRSGLRRFFLGSVAEAILRHAHTPVLCFPPRDAELKREHNDTKRVILTTDISKEALRAFGPVFQLAEEMNWHVTVLHVVREAAIIPASGHLSPVECPQDLDQEIRNARKAVEAQCAAFSPRVDFDIQVISHLTPAKGVVGFAAKHHVDLITFSTHGHTGFRRLVLGSVAEYVLRHSSVPILCFPRP